MCAHIKTSVGFAWEKYKNRECRAKDHPKDVFDLRDRDEGPLWSDLCRKKNTMDEPHQLVGGGVVVSTSAIRLGPRSGAKRRRIIGGPSATEDIAAAATDLVVPSFTRLSFIAASFAPSQ